MKKLPFIIGIPLVAVALVAGGAMIWKLKTQSTEIRSKAAGTLPNSFSKAGGSKPTNPFSVLFGSGSTQIPTPTPASAAAMDAELNAVLDDGGESDFTNLEAQVDGL